MVLLLSCEQPKLSFRIEPAASVVIGRSKDAQVRVPVLTVARKQTIVSFANGAWTASDAGSPAGTWINDERLMPGTPLNNGDRLRVGGVTLAIAIAPA